jgi:ABC-type Fe3+/spermidine/putrescine transport system ATPase subunit
VGFGYAGAPLWSDLVYDFPAGAWCGLVGPNGCGKSTLLRLLAGWQPWQRGELFVGSHPVHACPPEKRPLVLLTGRPSLYGHLTVRENVHFPVRCFGGADHTAELLDRLRLSSLAKCYPQQLSTGQQQRVAWARALQRPAAWILADEALASLDGEHRHILWQLLRNWLPTRHTGLVLVTHQLESDLPWLQHLSLLNNGSIQRLEPSSLFSDPGSLWLARQLCAEWVWRAETLNAGVGWVWVAPEAWTRVSAGEGWAAKWLRPATRAACRGWQVECLERTFFIPGDPGSGDLAILPGNLRTLTE